MDMKTEKTQTPETQKRKFNLCLTCPRYCSMSGLCMRQWPEFVKQRKEKTKG